MKTTTELVLEGKMALITGGDSGIAYAKEGAKVAIAYLDEHEDAKETKHLVEKHDSQCLTGASQVCKKTIRSAGVPPAIGSQIAGETPALQKLRCSRASPLPVTSATNGFAS